MATNEGQQALGGIGRRSVLRGGLIAGAGVATIGAASGVFTGTAKAATPDPQLGWAHCTQCAAMWWTGGGGRNACPGTPNISGVGPHAKAAGAYDYEIYTNTAGHTGSTNPQANWRWCINCSALFWSNNAGECWGNDNLPHVAGGANYLINYNEANRGTTTNPQAYWRWCGPCSVLFWSGPSTRSAGFCAATATEASISPHSGTASSYDLYHSGTF